MSSEDDNGPGQPRKGLCLRIMEFTWKDYPFETFSKVLSQAPCVPRIFRTFLRIISAIYVVTLEIYFFRPSNLVQFTHWGVISVAITFTVLAIHELLILFSQSYKNYISSKKEDLTMKDYISLPRWAIFWVNQAFIMQHLIVGFYWVAIYPSSTHSSKRSRIQGFLDHITPAGLIFIEVAIGKMTFSYRILIFVTVILCCYGIVNVTYSFVVSPVYSVLDPHYLTTWIMLIAFPIAQALIYVGYLYLFRWRFNKYEAITERNGSPISKNQIQENKLINDSNNNESRITFE